MRPRSVGLLWQMTKADIEETLKHVCKKVLHDHSVSERTRQRRAQALLILGEQYVLRRVRDIDGIQEFVERIGRQTGIFSDHPDFSPFGVGKEGEQKAGDFGTSEDAFFSDALSKEALLEMQTRVDTSSVRELKEAIAALSGNPADAAHCIEKEDLRKYVHELLLVRLSMLEEPNGGVA
jgi:hypothetical protein